MPRPRVACGQYPGCNAPDQASLALEDSEVGRYDKLGFRDRVADSPARRFAQEPGEDGTGFCVKDQRSPRSSSRRR